MEFTANESRSDDRGRNPLDRTAEARSESARNDSRETASAASGPIVPPRPSKPKLASGLESAGIVAANAGDHKLVHTLLRAVYQAPSYEDFITWLDDPTYEPLDRLLVKQGGRIVAHVQVLDRVAWFGGRRLPVGGVQDLATLPEYREAGYERLLLGAAEQTMRDRQAVVAFARTDRPELFRAGGWSEVLGQRFTEANVGDILANLASPDTHRRRRSRSLRIRLWRHVELDALRRVYRHAAEKAWGAVDRSEPYWRWLVGRKAHDELIVAVHGRDHWDELDKPANIVGYAVTHGSQVVELCCLAGFARVGPRLLARACQDAIEQDHRTMSLRLPATHPLHEMMIASGGRWCTDSRAQGGTMLVKLLDRSRWIESIYPVLLARAKAAGIPRPYHVTFHTGRESCRLDLTRRSGRITPQADHAADVHCTPEALAALLVGNLEVGQARDAGDLTVRDDPTAGRLAALFLPTTFWQSPFDLLRF